jgi:hypothetical protein
MLENGLYRLVTLCHASSRFITPCHGLQNTFWRRRFKAFLSVFKHFEKFYGHGMVTRWSRDGHGNRSKTDREMYYDLKNNWAAILFIHSFETTAAIKFIIIISADSGISYFLAAFR